MSTHVVSRVRNAGRSALRVAAIMAVVSGPVLSGATARASTIGWHQIFASTVPEARLAPAMAWDPVSQRIVLFGGDGANRFLNDTWTWDGTNWSKVDTPVAPPRRDAAGFGYDARTKRLVLYGGGNGFHYLGDTWTWDGATQTWTEQPPPPDRVALPPAVTGPSIFIDPKNGHADMFGGFDGMFYQLETWRWSGTYWVKLHPATKPFARAAAVASLDAATRQVVLFGGLGDVNPYNTWLWDGTTWTEASPSMQPPLLYNSASAYDPRSKAVELFGGGSGGVDSEETWGWTGSDWEFANLSSSPPARESEGMAYDPAMGRIVMFGGAAGHTLFKDTWAL